MWKVGQGQWTTWVREEDCWHFDMGGESLPFARAGKVCGQKINWIFLSHWDWDHIGGLKKASRFFPQLCLARRPLGATSARKKNLLPKKLCPTLPAKLWEWAPAENSLSKISNERSRVFATPRFLVTGDSPQKEERVWAADAELPQVSLLVLGHHGSRTSTSDFLLSRLPQLKQAVCSSRWERYGHPHSETLVRLRWARIPVLRTEDWGNLWFGI